MICCANCNDEIKCNCGYNCVPCVKLWHETVLYDNKIVNFCSILCLRGIKKCKQCNKLLVYVLFDISKIENNNGVYDNTTFCNKFCHDLWRIQTDMNHMQMDEEDPFDNIDEEDCNYDSY